MNRIESIHVAPTTEKKTEPGRFERALRSAAHSVASGLAATVGLAAPYVPGGMVLSAAVRGAAASGGGAARGGPLAGAGSAAGEGDMVEAARTIQQEAQASNLRFLQLQESVQRESREYTALSNVMKVKHDSAKAAIHNIH
ncbi:MAG TPA: hypothetical protein VLS93_08540 [Anaeromyxobacteraceae bacterium]|nr:hypothetical protein [Anaeromyxobacteraceae bacterium]